MAPRIVPCSHGVKTDFVVRTRADFPFAAMTEGVDSHLFRDDIAELKSRAARSVDLVTVMTFDNLDVGVGVFQSARGDLRELHRQVDGRTHARRAKNGNRLRRFFETRDLFGIEPGRGVNQSDFTLNAEGEERIERRGRREVDDDVGSRGGGKRVGNRHVETSDARVFARVKSQSGRTGGVESGDDFQRVVVGS